MKDRAKATRDAWVAIADAADRGNAALNEGRQDLEVRGHPLTTRPDSGF